MKHLSQIFTVCFFLFFISCKQENSSKLTIAAAANMQFAMQELTQTFTQETGIGCDFIVSSSGKLTAQIKEGAPYDVFVSADMKSPNKLYHSGFTKEKTKVYAFGKLVIWTMNTQLKPNFESLKTNHIHHIALANPKIAPYGFAAVEALKNKDLYSILQPKFVFGESVAQTNQFIVSSVAEIGFTAKSVVLSKHMKGKGLWKEIDANLYTPIAQGIVLLKNRKIHLDDAKKFQDFLFSVKGKEILNKFGYVTAE